MSPCLESLPLLHVSILQKLASIRMRATVHSTLLDNVNLVSVSPEIPYVGSWKLRGYRRQENLRSDSLGLWTLLIVRNPNQLENTTFRKLDLVPSSGEGVGDTYCIGNIRES
jgi:hypothetical protein